MTRRPTIWSGVLAILLVVCVWRFTTAFFAIQNRWWTSVFVPILLAVISMGLFIYGWKSETSGSIPSAGAFLGLSAAFLWRLSDANRFSWMAALGLVPALAGAGVLVEISRGHGWRFTRKQGIGLILTGGIVILAFGLLTNPGRHSAESLLVFNPFSGWSNFAGVFSDVWALFGSFFQMIVR